MKTFIRLIRRYVLAAVGFVMLLFISGICFLGWTAWYEATYLPQREYSFSDIADSMIETKDGIVFGPQHTPQEWMDGYAWCMVLDDNGNVKWDYQLPSELNKHYTVNDIANFTRWYLDDYPVFCQTRDYGLFVIGLPKGSLWKYNFYSTPALLRSMVHNLPVVVLVLLLTGLLFCLWLGWRGTKRLETVAAGLDALANGQTVQLPTNGFTGELAKKLNQTSSHLQKRNEMLARRDDTRTQWIAGVSHDVRTPLALILGWAEQLKQDEELPDAARQKAAGICRQSEKLRRLIDDLNLTSKLEYGAQPLRKKVCSAGPLIRKLVAQFYDSPLAEKCEISLVQSSEAEHSLLSVDEGLLGRLMENLLNNSVRHNSEDVKIFIKTCISENFFLMTITDDGKGYPTEVLTTLNSEKIQENAPHILGLHVVEQIAAAHGGKTLFSQNTPYGAKTIIWLPLS